jgi:hypothetical protein
MKATLILLAIVMLVSVAAQAFGQSGPRTEVLPPKPHTMAAPPAPESVPGPSVITVKPSPAEDALVQAAKDAQVQHESFNVAQQQANQTLSTKQKALQDKLNQANVQCWEKVKADKHYRDLVKQIVDAQAELQKSQTDAQTAFAAQTTKVQQAIATDNAQIQGLIPIVRKENGLADTDRFDEQSQTWKR